MCNWSLKCPNRPLLAKVTGKGQMQGQHECTLVCICMLIGSWNYWYLQLYEVRINNSTCKHILHVCTVYSM